MGDIPKKKKLVIVGMGPGGIAAALKALQSKDPEFEVHIFESRSEFVRQNKVSCKETTLKEVINPMIDQYSAWSKQKLELDSTKTDYYERQNNIIKSTKTSSTDSEYEFTEVANIQKAFIAYTEKIANELPGKLQIHSPKSLESHAWVDDLQISGVMNGQDIYLSDGSQLEYDDIICADGAARQVSQHLFEFERCDFQPSVNLHIVGRVTRQKIDAKAEGSTRFVEKNAIFQDYHWPYTSSPQIARRILHFNKDPAFTDYVSYMAPSELIFLEGDQQHDAIIEWLSLNASHDFSHEELDDYQRALFLTSMPKVPISAAAQKVSIAPLDFTRYRARQTLREIQNAQGITKRQYCVGDAAQNTDYLAADGAELSIKGSVAAVESIINNNSNHFLNESKKCMRRSSEEAMKNDRFIGNELFQEHYEGKINDINVTVIVLLKALSENTCYVDSILGYNSLKTTITSDGLLTDTLKLGSDFQLFLNHLVCKYTNDPRKRASILEHIIPTVFPHGAINFNEGHMLLIGLEVMYNTMNRKSWNEPIAYAAFDEWLLAEVKDYKKIQKPQLTQHTSPDVLRLYIKDIRGNYPSGEEVTEESIVKSIIAAFKNNDPTRIPKIKLTGDFFDLRIALHFKLDLNDSDNQQYFHDFINQYPNYAAEKKWITELMSQTKDGVAIRVEGPQLIQYPGHTANNVTLQPSREYQDYSRAPITPFSQQRPYFNSLHRIAPSTWDQVTISKTLNMKIMVNSNEISAQDYLNGIDTLNSSEIINIIHHLTMNKNPDEDFAALMQTQKNVSGFNARFKLFKQKYLRRNTEVELSSQKFSDLIYSADPELGIFLNSIGGLFCLVSSNQDLYPQFTNDDDTKTTLNNYILNNTDKDLILNTYANLINQQFDEGENFNVEGFINTILPESSQLRTPLIARVFRTFFLKNQSLPDLFSNFDPHSKKILREYLRHPDPTLKERIKSFKDLATVAKLLDENDFELFLNNLKSYGAIKLDGSFIDDFILAVPHRPQLFAKHDIITFAKPLSVFSFNTNEHSFADLQRIACSLQHPGGFISFLQEFIRQQGSSCFSGDLFDDFIDSNEVPLQSKKDLLNSEIFNIDWVKNYEEVKEIATMLNKSDFQSFLDKNLAESNKPLGGSLINFVANNSSESIISLISRDNVKNILSTDPKSLSEILFSNEIPRETKGLILETMGKDCLKKLYINVNSDFIRNHTIPSLKHSSAYGELNSKRTQQAVFLKSLKKYLDSGGENVEMLIPINIGPKHAANSLLPARKK